MHRRSRGGLTTKIHALINANGLPVRLKRTKGQAHDGRSAADMLTGLGHGQILMADRAYDSDALRQTIYRAGSLDQHQADAPARERPRLQPLLVPI